MAHLVVLDFFIVKMLIVKPSTMYHTVSLMTIKSVPNKNMLINI